MEPAPTAQPDPASAGTLPAADELLKTLPWGVLVVDAQGSVQRINQQAAYWCGVQPTALLGQPLAQAALLPAVRDTLLQLLEPGEVAPREVWLPEQACWIALSATRQPAGWVLYMQDITPQKRREQQYQTLAENTPDVLSRWGPDLRLRYANAAFAARAGQPQSALPGHSLQELDVPADVSGPYLADLQRVFDTGQPQEHYNHLLTPRGTTYYYSRLVPELRNGEVDTVLGIARDITELKQSQAEALRLRDELTQQATDKYHALFHTMDQGFCVLEILFDDEQQAVDFRYLELNPVFARQSGMPGNALGKTARELVPDLSSFWFDTYGEVVRTGNTVRLEHHVPQVGRWFDVHAFRVGAPEARQVAVLFNDITGRKQAEERLRQAAAADTFRLRLADALGPLAAPVAIQEAVTSLAREYFEADRCYYCELEGDLAIIRRDAAADGLPSVAGTYPIASFTLLQAVISTGRPFVVRDVRQEASVDENLRLLCLQLEGISYLNVPVIKNGQPIGVLSLVQREPREWTAAEVALASEVAERTWTAVERANAEEDLRVSEENYRTLFTSIDEGFCTVEVLFDAQGRATDYRFLELNPAFERQTGLTNALGRTMRTLAPQLEDFWLDTYGHVARTGEAQRFGHPAAALGKYFEGYAFRIGDPAEHRVAILFNDVLARKQAEETLRKSEEQFRLFVTASSDILYRMDAGWQHMLQLDGRSLLADTLSPSATWLETYIPPTDRASITAAIEAATDGHCFFELEHRVFRVDGSIGWLFSRAVPVLNAGGELVEWFGTATDITARKEAEEALRLSEERLQLALQAGQMGSFEWTSEGNRITLSPMSEEVLGLLPGHAFTTSDEGFALVHPDDRAQHQAVFEQAGRSGEDFHSIYRIVRPRDGQLRWIEERGQGTHDSATSGICLRGVHWDVTEQVATQQQLAEFNTRLEQRVARRTHELQASHDLLKSVFDTNLIAMSLLFAVRDDAGRVQDFRLGLVNKELERSTGRTDLVGKLYAQEYPGIKQVGIFDLMLRTLATGEPQGMEYFYDYEGFRQWFACQFVKMDDGLVATNLDITERRTAEQERTRNLYLLEQAEAVAGLGSWDYNLLTQKFIWSDGMYRLFGLPVGQPVEANIYTHFVLDEDRPRAEQLLKRLTTGSGNFEETLRLLVGNELKTLRIKAVVLHDEASQPVRVLGVDLDISELQRLEADNLRLRLTQQQALFEAVQAAQETERKRMAESLHNGIGQILYATKLRLDRLHAPVLHTLPALVEARQEADQLLGEAIRQTRALSHELVPMTLKEFGLAAALQDISRKMSAPPLRLRSHILFDEEAAPLSASLQMALYRIAQELAQNVVKHARGATEASIELETMPGWVLLRAEDNGPGFAPGAAEGPGLGLRSIRDRVALLGGQLEIGSALVGGAYVRIRIPLPLPPPHDTPVSRR
jgi:PAS domain S-box-containing protein